MIAIGFAILVILLAAAVVAIAIWLARSRQQTCRYNGPVVVSRDRTRNPEKVER